MGPVELAAPSETDRDKDEDRVRSVFRIPAHSQGHRQTTVAPSPTASAHHPEPLRAKVAVSDTTSALLVGARVAVSAHPSGAHVAAALTSSSAGAGQCVAGMVAPTGYSAIGIDFVGVKFASAPTTEGPGDRPTPGWHHHLTSTTQSDIMRRLNR